MEFLVKPTMSPSNIDFCPPVGGPSVPCPDPRCPLHVVYKPCPPVECQWIGCGSGNIGPMEVSVAPVEII